MEIIFFLKKKLMKNQKKKTWKRTQTILQTESSLPNKKMSQVCSPMRNEKCLGLTFKTDMFVTSKTE